MMTRSGSTSVRMVRQTLISMKRSKFGARVGQVEAWRERYRWLLILLCVKESFGA